MFVDANIKSISNGLGMVITAVIAIGLFFLLVALVIFWVLFPVFVYFGMRRMENQLHWIKKATERAAGKD